MRPYVGVIILNWNRQADTLACLDSLTHQTYPNYHLILVDNGSIDESVAAVRDRFPEVTVLENGTNLGFSEGNNVGMRYALAQGADYILLLNNDTISDPGLIEALVRVMEIDDQIGAVGPKILYQSEPERLWSAGGIINYTETVTRMRGYRQIDQGQFDVLQEVDFVPGCAILVCRRLLEQIGLLDPIYSPAYFEDTDWCVRAHQNGYKILYVPQARVWHKVSLSSGGEYNLKERYLLGFNSIIFMRRYANLTEWVKYLFYAVGSLPILYLLRVSQGKGKCVVAKALGIFDSLRGLKPRKIFLK